MKIDKPIYAPSGKYKLALNDKGDITFIDTVPSDKVDIVYTEPLTEYLAPEAFVSQNGVQALVDPETGEYTFTPQSVAIVNEEHHRPLNPYTRYMQQKGVAPKDNEVEHLMERHRADQAGERADLTPFFANLMTGGYAEAAKRGWEDIKNKKYFTGGTEILSPLMFGENYWNNLAQGLYGGIHLLNDNGVPKTWREIKEGNYGNAALSGIGDALNLLLLKQIHNPERWRTVWYNNLTPGSYSSKISWHPKGKIEGEAPQAIKDYFSFWKEVEQNPKWYDYFKKGDIDGLDMWEKFPINDPNINAELRKEAFQIYQGMEHIPKYILDTGQVDAYGNKIYTLNLEEIPDSGLVEFIKRASYLKKGTGITYDLGNYGGNVLYNKQINGNQFTFTINDLFDVQPLQDPSRIVKTMPRWMSNILFKQTISPESKYISSYQHRAWVPNWLKNFEIGKITGGKPFRSITRLEGDVLKEYPEPPITDKMIQQKRQYNI